VTFRGFSREGLLQDLAVSHDLIMAALGRRLPLPCIIWLGLHGSSCDDIHLATPWDQSQTWVSDPSLEPPSDEEEDSSPFADLKYPSQDPGKVLGGEEVEVRPPLSIASSYAPIYI